MPAAKNPVSRKPQKAAAVGKSLPKFSTSEQFKALPDADKERVWESFDREIPLEETKPLTVRQRKLWDKAKRRTRRPGVKGSAKVISLSVEKSLLDRADAYAKATGLTRARLVAMGLEAVLGTGRRTDAQGK